MPLEDRRGMVRLEDLMPLEVRRGSVRGMGYLLVGKGNKNWDVEWYAIALHGVWVVK